MGLPHGVSPITFFYVHNIYLYISNSLQIHTNFYLYITQILLLYSSTDKLRSFVFTSLVYTLNTIGIERSIIPGETAFKPMGHPYGVSPNPPMYIHISLYINTRSCTYLLPCTHFKLVNKQVALVFKRSFHRHLFIFPS